MSAEPALACDRLPCGACGRPTPIHDLDAKPSRWANPAGAVERIVRRLLGGQVRILRRAADAGVDFDRLECRNCYGPGYVSAEPTLEPDECDDWTECWSCGGEGTYADCEEEWACVDPESGCDLCTRRCDVCRGKSGWSATSDERASA